MKKKNSRVQMDKLRENSRVQRYKQRKKSRVQMDKLSENSRVQRDK